MTINIRRVLYKKITKLIKNTEDAMNIISCLHMKQRQPGVFSFILPLQTKQYNFRNNIETLLNSVRKSYLNNITVEKDILSFNVLREDYIKQLLESNYHKAASSLLIDGSKNVIVEFSSPNIAKPFHLGHLRSTIIGNYVANINSYLGNNVKRINYLGDWGTQYGFTQVGIEMSNFDSKNIQDDAIRSLYNAYVLANKSAENDISIANKAREIFRQLEIGESTAYEEWELFRKYTIEDLKKTYGRIGITFDEYHWESMYKKTNLKQIIELMENMNLLKYDRENRKVIQLEIDKVIPIIKSDGTSLYLTRDVGAAIDRYKKYKFDVMYYVVDQTQSKHFTNLIEILHKMNMPWAERLKHIRYGRVIGMSTRKGTAIFLKDILNEIKDVAREKQIQSPTTKVSLDSSDNSSDILGISAVIINDLKQKRQRDYTFNWNTAFNIKGDTGIKLQYVHCRLCNLEENSGVTLPTECYPSVLKEPIVDDLICIISNFENTVLRSYQDLEPCILVGYLFKLSYTINKAFETLQVKGETVDISNQRLLLFHVAKNVLAQGMKLLGLTPLSKM
ncbi:PREDICTED: probable arginine--tRNA ligase, mitochondrial [Polistes canadensis]|uniref:probable arginine--tRNA ligase, mitochondrial n=1 Tax=Polistes canadensis TaxID=91411 RepID=UPI000718E18F|nr:PREDICTED: probable arginine--tRNA ligase, mitochondrial [Polistes canadensis]